LAETFPNPTLVKLLHVKYSAVKYDVRISGLFVLLASIGSSIRSPNSKSQPEMNKKRFLHLKFVFHTFVNCGMMCLGFALNFST